MPRMIGCKASLANEMMPIETAGPCAHRAAVAARAKRSTLDTAPRLPQCAPAVQLLLDAHLAVMCRRSNWRMPLLGSSRARDSMPTSPKPCHVRQRHVA